MIADQMLAPVPGGTGRYTRELLAAMAATAPRGWTVSSVVSRGGDPAAAVVPGVRGPRVLPLPRRALVALWQAGVPFWPGGNALHAPTPLAPPRKPRCGRSRGASLVVTVHDTVPWSHPHTLTPRGVAWHRSMIARAMRTADVVVVPTQAVADELSEHVSGPAEVRVVPHGVSALAASGAGHALDLPERYVLAVGTLEPRKGIDVLIAAIARAHAEGGAARNLVLVGQPGWGGLDPAALAAEHGLPPGAVRVLGKLPDAELAEVLRRASALVMPSLAEGFGLPLLEGMAAGVPVVHSDAPALVEVAGGAGMIVPRGDAAALSYTLDQVLGDPALAAGLAEKGRLRAGEFSWHRAAEAMWTLHIGAQHRIAPGDIAGS